MRAPWNRLPSWHILAVIVTVLVGSMLLTAARPATGAKGPKRQPAPSPSPSLTPAESETPSPDPSVLLREDFESFALGGWQQSRAYGNWFVQFNGYGSSGIETDGTNVHSQAPAASTAASETHANLITSVPTFGDIDVTLRMKTVRQLRTPTPNPWETAWFFWHYTDNTHFYYVTLKPNGWELGKEDPAYPGAQRFLATGGGSFAIGRWYTVRVRQVGATMSVWADGVLLTTFTDGERPYSAGSIGLYNEDAHVRFDDIVVQTP